MSGETSRLDWVDTAKGISIILVVMMYSVFNVGSDTGEAGFWHYVIGFATPFRMPEFFLISGLFLSLVIARPWRALPSGCTVVSPLASVCLQCTPHRLRIR